MVARKHGDEVRAADGQDRIALADAASRAAALVYSPDEVSGRADEIYHLVLEESGTIDDGNFDSAHPDDLKRLFHTYDEVFFDGLFGCLLRSGNHQISFRFSSRMTSAGGKTGRRPLGRAGASYAFEIAVSTVLLAMGFDESARKITVCGRECGDRLQALQRVFEHELIHLLEMLIWGKSSCAARQFAGLAGRIFGHTEMTHRMITPREHAAVEHGIRAGDRVEFEFEGDRHVGIVNRITRRATVLVESADGRLYSDGNRYAKFYVPVEALTRA